MKRQIIITILLIAATVMITYTYFKHLNPPGRRANQVINTIPPSAAFVFEFNNDGSFFEIYDKSQLFTAITGGTKMRELQTLRRTLLNNNFLKSYFAQQDIFISLHAQPNDSLEYLVTLPATHTLEQAAMNQLKANRAGWTIKPLTIAGKKGYDVHIDSLQKSFYLAEKPGNIWAGSFSKTLLEQSLNYKPTDNKATFAQLADQQSANLLANLYVNHKQLTPLLTQIYKSNNIDLWKGLEMLPASTALNLNYKSDALMFNGFTTLNKEQATSYLNLFRGMQPVENTLHDIFPLTTAYSNSYAVDNVTQFKKLLAGWQQKAGLDKEKAKLFKLIKNETGVQFNREFDALLANEFAVVTTKFQEKLAIIKVSNGAKLRPFVNNISTMVDEEIGQFNYNQVPLFMLGDALTPFRRPYFIIIDNYLILGNTARELSNYKENYFNNAFLSKNEEYTEFNNLLAQRSNVCFFIHFKNAGAVFKRSLKRGYANAYQREPGFKNYYAAAYQLSASDNEYYTNLCIKLNSPDSVKSGK
jgi:hypothetical protein